MVLYLRELKIRSCLGGDYASLTSGTIIRPQVARASKDSNYVFIFNEIKNPQMITAMAKYITATYSK